MLHEEKAPSLYQRLGGEAAIQAAVDLFYDKVLADPLLAPYFDSLDMTKQVRKQISFMAWAFGGPEEYKQRDLTSAHAAIVKQGVSDAHFDAVAGHLRATLLELEIAPALIDEVLALVGGTRDAVLGR